METFFVNITDENGTLVDRLNIGVAIDNIEMDKFINNLDIDQLYTIEELEPQKFDFSFEGKIKRSILLFIEKQIASAALALQNKK